MLIYFPTTFLLTIKTSAENERRVDLRVVIFELKKKRQSKLAFLSYKSFCVIGAHVTFGGNTNIIKKKRKNKERIQKSYNIAAILFVSKPRKPVD